MKDESRVQPQVEMATALGLGKPIQSRRVPLWAWIGGAAIVVLALVYFFQPFSGGDATRYRMGEVTKGALTATVTATGTLQPVNEVDLGPEVSGQITKVLVDYNDRVKEGQILAIMDPETLNAHVVQSRAALVAAKARVDDAKATAVESHNKLERTRELFQRGNASKETLDTAEATDLRSRAAVGSADAQVKVSEASLSSDETALSKTEIKSPINGVILSRSVEPGQVVAATFQTPVLFKLAEDLTQMQLEVDVDEADIGHVQEGQAANFSVDAFQDRQFPATITQVRFAPKTVDSVVTYQAVLTVMNKDLLLRPGMTATATITTASRAEALLVPNAALRFTPKAAPAAERKGFSFGPPPDFMNAPAPPPLPKAGSMQRLFVLRGGKPEAVEVKIGISDGQRTEVVSGDLKPGDKVIIGTDSSAP